MKLTVANKNLKTPWGQFEGSLGGPKFDSLGKLPKGWTDRDQILYTCADSSGNGHRRNNIASLRPHGGILGEFYRVTNAIVWKASKWLDRL